MENDKLYIEIKDLDQKSFLRITPLAVPFHDSKLEIDRDTVSAEVEINIESFTAKYKIHFFASWFKKFKEEIKKLKEDLSGKILFATGWDEELKLEITGDGLGNFRMISKCLSFRRDSQINLEFEMEFDQTQIEGFVKQIENILEKLALNH